MPRFSGVYKIWEILAEMKKDRVAVLAVASVEEKDLAEAAGHRLCIKLLVVNAAPVASFLSDQPEIDRYFVAIVLENNKTMPAQDRIDSAMIGVKDLVLKIKGCMTRRVPNVEILAKYLSDQPEIDLYFAVIVLENRTARERVRTKERF